MRIWIAVAAAASAVIALAACGSPEATTTVRPAAHTSSAAAQPAASTPDPLQSMTTRQEKDVCTELRATVTVDRDAGMAFNPVPLEWQIAVQYKTASGGSIAGAFYVLARATGYECPSLSWTLNDMPES